jgi:hypothetical protein
MGMLVEPEAGIAGTHDQSALFSPRRRRGRRPLRPSTEASCRHACGQTEAGEKGDPTQDGRAHRPYRSTEEGEQSLTKATRPGFEDLSHKGRLGMRTKGWKARRH